MNQKALEAIDNLYEVFGEFPKPLNIEGCPCCVDEKDTFTLLSKPLRSLTDQELSSYASSLFLTVGDEADFRYFLPRIFEISANEVGWWPDPEIVLGKLRRAGWNSWTPKEREAILKFIDAVLDDCMKDSQSDIDTWVCAIAHCVDDMIPYLEKIKQNTESLIRLYEENSQALIKGKLSNAFWEDARDKGVQVIEWFNSPEIIKIINEYYKKK